MDEKWARAKALVKEGRSNSDILAILKKEFGSGVTTAKLAEWRLEGKGRLTQQKRQEMSAAKRALVRQMLSEGSSGYACQQECRAQFGSGVGYELIQEIQAELKACPPGAVQPIELPSDLYEESNVYKGEPPLHHESPEDLLADASPEEPSPEEPGEPLELAVVAPPKINGTLASIRSIQRWMASIRAESMTLTQDGRLTMVVRHEFNLGGVE